MAYTRVGGSTLFLGQSGDTLPTGAAIGERAHAVDTDQDYVYDGASWYSTGGGADVIKSVEKTFEETTGAGVYTATVPIPAGATLVDIKLRSPALWTATTSANAKVGDDLDDDGWFTNVDLKATDLLVGEEISFAQPGGKQGAYLDTTTGKRSAVYKATAWNVIMVVTTVGAAGNAGRSRFMVLYTLPTPTVATKV